jgi:hypothetical protein
LTPLVLLSWPMVIIFHFAGKSFDYVIASHILEHTNEPAMFLNELQGVSKAGYIEPPHAFMEHIIPYGLHRLRVSVQDDTLIITKKSYQAPN